VCPFSKGDTRGIWPKAQVLRCTASQDAGKAARPSYVEGHKQGGTVQNVGWALNEEYVMSDEAALPNYGLLDDDQPGRANDRHRHR